jgi:hypothetical protein
MARTTKRRVPSKAEDRQALLDFLSAIDARRSALRRDECGDWAILGKQGHIYSVGVNGTAAYQLFVSTSDRALKWAWVKKKLSFCEVTQDGDDEAVSSLIVCR